MSLLVQEAVCLFYSFQDHCQRNLSDRLSSVVFSQLVMVMKLLLPSALLTRLWLAGLSVVV